MPTCLARIDLSRPVQPLSIKDRYDSLMILACWGITPLGVLKVPCSGPRRTLQSAELQERLLEAFGWRLWQGAAGLNLLEAGGRPAQGLPEISVIVCTLNRPASLARCLKTLNHLDYPSWEGIVVDNGSDGSQVEEVARSHGFRYVREDRIGLDRARNRGIEAAQHSIVAFIDDDALASPGWLRGIARGFEDERVMAVTGLVLPGELETPAQQAFEAYGGMSKGFQAFTIRRDRLSKDRLFESHAWGVGTNMAFRRSLFAQIGVFDPALDVGTPTRGGGDLEFFFRTVAAGHLLRYEPSALVAHVHRRDQAALMQQIFNNGCSYPAYLLTAARAQPHLRQSVLQYTLKNWLVGWLLRRLVASLLKRDRETFSLMLSELRGGLSALPSYLRSQRAVRRSERKNTGGMPVETG